MTARGHFRQIDPLPTLSACPLRSDRVRTSAPQRIDAVCHEPRPRQGVSTSSSGAAHVAFERIKTLGPCDICSFVAKSHTPSKRCVRFATTVASGHATLATKRTLLLTWAGLAPADRAALPGAFPHSITSSAMARSPRDHGRVRHRASCPPIDTMFSFCSRSRGSRCECIGAFARIEARDGCPPRSRDRLSHCDLRRRCAGDVARYACVEHIPGSRSRTIDRSNLNGLRAGADAQGTSAGEKDLEVVIGDISRSAYFSL